MDIGLIGQVSTGKSSFLNALTGQPSANVSILRETFIPEQWYFNYNKISNMDKINEENKIIHEKTLKQRKMTSYTSDKEINKKILRGFNQSILISKKFGLTDYAGINDSSDINDRFVDVFLNNMLEHNIIIYITSAETAFTLKSEIQHFKKIQDYVNKYNKEGYYKELIIIVNKYDYQDDDLDIIIDNAKEQIKDVMFYRISSYHLFAYNNRMLGRNISIPENFQKEYKKILRTCCIKNLLEETEHNGDFDDLFGYLTNLDILSKQINCLKKSITLSITNKCYNNIFQKIERLKKLTDDIWTDNFISKTMNIININPSYHKLVLLYELYRSGMPSQKLKIQKFLFAGDECLYHLFCILIQNKFDHEIDIKLLITCLSSKCAWETNILPQNTYNISYKILLFRSKCTPVEELKKIKWASHYKYIPKLIEFAQQPIKKLYITNLNYPNYYVDLFSIISENYKPVMDYINYTIFNDVNIMQSCITGLENDIRSGIPAECMNTNFAKTHIHSNNTLLEKVFMPPIIDNIDKNIYYKYK
jgi:hypothetical protein